MSARRAGATRRYYPVFLDLEGRLAVVVGDGEAAAVRVEALLAVGAHVRSVGAKPAPRVRELAAAGEVELRERAYREGDLEGGALAIALGAEATNAAARAEATARRVPLSVTDDPARCDWIHGAVLRRGPLVVAISTSGAAPALAVRLKERFARELGPEYARFLELAAEYREALAGSAERFEERREVWYSLVDSDALAALADGDEARGRAAFEAALVSAREGRRTGPRSTRVEATEVGGSAKR